MQSNHSDLNNISRQKAIYRYVQALDQSDLETIATILDLAVNDPELDRAIIEINQHIEEEENLTSFAEKAEIVRNLVRTHLPSAFEPNKPVDSPLTVGEVAARLKAEQLVPFTDQEANEQLLNVSHPLPAWLNMQAVQQLAVGLQVTASERYWRAFRDAAIMLGMGRSHQSQLLAAREERLRNEARKPRENNPKRADKDMNGDE
jgi:hypothetical protein